MKDKIGKLTINISLICENDNYCELKNFIQIDNYCESGEVRGQGTHPFWGGKVELANDAIRKYIIIE